MPTVHLHSNGWLVAGYLPGQLFISDPRPVRVDNRSGSPA